MVSTYKNSYKIIPSVTNMNKVNVKDIKRAIADIEKLNLDLGRLDRRATPDIVGFYGELLAWKQLKSHFGWQGFNIILGKGQSRADIVMEKKRRNLNVEIKTSRLKDEGFGNWYGVALNVKPCKIKEHSNRTFSHPKRGLLKGDFCYFDFLIFVKIHKIFHKHDFYIFPKDYLWQKRQKLRNTHARFSSSTHRIILSDRKAIPRIQKRDLQMIKQMEKYQNKWKLIK